MSHLNYPRLFGRTLSDILVSFRIFFPLIGHLLQSIIELNLYVVVPSDHPLVFWPSTGPKWSAAYWTLLSLVKWPSEHLWVFPCNNNYAPSYLFWILVCCSFVFCRGLLCELCNYLLIKLEIYTRYLITKLCKINIASRVLNSNRLNSANIRQCCSVLLVFGRWVRYVPPSISASFLVSIFHSLTYPSQLEPTSTHHDGHSASRESTKVQTINEVYN